MSERPVSPSPPLNGPPMLRTAQTIYDGWTFLIVREAFFGVRRFEEFRNALGIPRARLVERLSDLVTMKVMEKQPYCERPPRHEYVLTEQGHDIYAMALALMEWGDRWRESKAPRLELVHRFCGQPVEISIVCGRCGHAATPDTIQLSPAAPEDGKAQFRVKRQLKQSAYANDSRHDAVARTLSVIGDQWTMALLDQAFTERVQTFDAFRESTGIARGTLSSRLVHLVAEGILAKRLYQQTPPRYSYHLTEAGRDLFGIVVLMHSWGARWLFAEQPTMTNHIHSSCGEPVDAVIVCRHCRKPLASRDVERPGAG